MELQKWIIPGQQTLLDRMANSFFLMLLKKQVNFMIQKQKTYKTTDTFLCGQLDRNSLMQLLLCYLKAIRLLIVSLGLNQESFQINGQGYHLRHNKEICLVGLKGKVPDGVNSFTVSDLIQSIPGKHSQKPVEIKQLIEKLYPNGHYCELFGRKNNLRDGWVTIGNEL
ncbi:MT-A70 family protein [Oxytricha trifallax]|uniref:mRNA m(6)A methyltransferase n=1 Tax=Oxytricha trifallax TaxID=1172189 RepID=A0A073I0C0_9SPIT|nr:MT-A70 family protein [Oxytricha trifallax]